jgi:opacity protein-like surface antigen
MGGGSARIAGFAVLMSLAASSSAGPTRAEPASQAETMPPSGSIPAESIPAESPLSASGERSDESVEAKGRPAFYLSLGAGASWPQPVDYSDDRLGPLLPIEGHVQSTPGFASDLGLGYDFGRLRGELSWVHRQATVASSRWSIGPLPVQSGSEGQPVSSDSLFASLYVDLPLPRTRLVPYLGGGLGYTALHTSPTTIQLGPTSTSFGGGSFGLLGYQAKAGLAYQSSPRSDLFAEAVYQGAPGSSQGSLNRSPLNSWGFRLGLRLRFGTAQQPEAPAANP